MNNRLHFLRPMALLLVLLVLGTGLASASSGEVPGGGPPGEGSASGRSASYLLSISPAGATQKVNPASANKSATYVFQLKNAGDASLPDCYLQLYPWTFPPDKWSYNFIPSCPFQVGTGETRNILLVIYPAPDAEAKRYTFQIKGSKDISCNSITINLDILQYGDVLVKAPPAQAAAPGETLEFNFEIINTGNGKDRFLCEAMTSIPTMVPSFKDGRNDTPDVPCGKTAVKTVIVTIPHDMRTTEGTNNIQLTFTARSNFNRSQEDTNWTYIFIEHVFDLSLGVSPASVALNPGAQAEFTVTVLNLGNGWDDIALTLSTSFDRSNWTISLGNGIFRLPAGRMNTTPLKVTPPLNALKADDYRLVITARSSGPPFPDMPLVRSETVTIAVRGLKGLRAPVQNFTAPSAIGPGELARFGFNFTNEGNSEDVVNITVMDKPLNWHASLDLFQNIRMQPYVTQEVSLTVQAPVNRNESRFQNYKVFVQIVNADRSSVLDLTFTIPVKPVYDWEFIVEEPVKGLVNPYADSVHGFTLLLTNKGNTGDEVQLAVGGDFASWGRLDTTALSLAYGEKRAVRLAVEVPQTAEVGREYGLKITAASVNSPGMVKEAGVSVAIIHIDVSVVPAGNLEINGQVWKDLKTNLGTRLNITVTIRNDGTESARGVNVRFYDNDIVFAERNTSTIAPLRTARFNIPWDAVSRGPHILKAKVDPGNLLREVNENDNEGSAEVTVIAMPPPPQPTQDPGWLYALVLICGVAGAGGGALAILRRRPSYDREMYESIYGRRGDAAVEQRMAAERAEIERRARERAEPVDRQAGF